MTNFLITNEGYGINLSLLEHFELIEKDVLLTVAGRTYTTTPKENMTIEDVGNVLSWAIAGDNNSVVHWSEIVQKIKIRKDATKNRYR